MVALKEVELMIQAKIPDALVFVKDLTGGGDHLQAVVVSAQFQGQTRVKQHQLVYGALEKAMSTESHPRFSIENIHPRSLANSRSTRISNSINFRRHYDTRTKKAY